MKRFLQKWFSEMFQWHEVSEQDCNGTDLEFNLLISGQIYGLEYYPSVHRYHEK